MSMLFKLLCFAILFVMHVPAEAKEKSQNKIKEMNSTKESSVDAADPLYIPEAIRAEMYHLQPISLDFEGASLREVIRMFSNETHINFIIPEDIGSQKVSLSLRNVPWDEALKALLKSHDLGIVRMDGDVVRIDSTSKIEGNHKKLEELRKKAALTTPTKVLVVRLSYSKADQMLGIINNLLPSKEFDKRVKVQADLRTNSIVVEAIPQELEKIKTLIQKIDLATPQVRIESRVVEIIESKENFLGINWGGPFNYDQKRGLGFGNLVFPNHFISDFSVDTGALTSSPNNGRFNIHIGSLNDITSLDLSLRMGEITNQSRNLQNNNVLVVDGETARLEAGTEDYFQIPTGDGQTELTSVNYLLALEVTPHITADGSVQMDLKIENSSPTDPSSSSAASSKSLRTLTTSMLKKTGETAVIGGLYTTSLVTTHQGLPFLKDIPILGYFFSSKAKTEQKRELIILVTPTIVSGKDRVPKAKDWSQDFKNQNENLTSNFENFLDENENEQGENLENNSNNFNNFNNFNDQSFNQW